MLSDNVQAVTMVDHSVIVHQKGDTRGSQWTRVTVDVTL